ncbi:serine/threonine-protein kinase [Saccharopolyspora cebuensis]|uniref:non-specific serine/threonine protein kinase n=1 Tax=Saccharopolyspora cebuensis TaxID=418759 RepID=A0ABV4CQ14_9PSEU
MSDEGRLVAGRYRVQRRIGSGAMGVVWECVDERLHRTVAVKQLLLQPGLDPGEAEEARQRAMREGRIAARLQHPNAISVYDVAEDEGQPVLVMEYLPSTSLGAMMSEHGPLPPREVARIGAQVASALGAAHSAGVVHRDIKPGNILLGDNGMVKITDFGISRAQGDVQVTKTGMLAGTPAYLSPDVAMGQEPTPASDVFSLGATLYAAIEGHPPFGLNENTLALLHAVAAGRIEPPQQAGAMTDPLMAMMAARVEDRPDMAQVREMLQQVSDGAAVTSIPTMAAPIPPALAPESSRPDLAPTSVTPQDRTTVAHYEDDPYTEQEYDDATSYMGKDTRADDVRERRSKRPMVVSGIAMVAVAVIAVLVTTALLRSPSQPENAGNQQPQNTQPALPPPPAPTTESTEQSQTYEEETSVTTTEQRTTTQQETTSEQTTEETTPSDETSEPPTQSSEDQETSAATETTGSGGAESTG